MLVKLQANRIWQEMFEAEVRSMYFGDLASRYTRRQQIISGISLFLSSGAAATILALVPSWIPVTMSAIVAGLTAYSISASLQRTIAMTTKLHVTWNQLAMDYERLWHHWQDEDAEEIFKQLQARASEASQLGTEAPYKEALIAKWEARTREKYVPATI